MSLRPLTALLSAAAGWMAVTWLTAADVTTRRETIDDAARPAASPSDWVAALRKFRAPGQSAERMAAMAAVLRDAPVSELTRLIAEVESWPQSTAKEVAMTMLRARLSPSEPIVDRVETSEPENPIQLLAAKLATGTPKGYGWESKLAEWTSLDPKAAIAAALNMPAGESRAVAVDRVAGAMADDDPAGALDFILQSGERQLGNGAAGAWMALAIKSDRDPAAGEFIQKLKCEQQSCLAEALAAKLKLRTGSPQAEMSIANLSRIWWAARRLPRGPARDSLAMAVERCQRQCDHIGMIPSIVGGSKVGWRSQAERATHLPKSLVDTLLNPKRFESVPGSQDALLAGTAPDLLPRFCRSGRLAEAVRLLAGVKDPQAWRAGFQAMLPYWMDSDPVAARAALEAAPLTALERERWLQHPAFLLNPAK